MTDIFENQAEGQMAESRPMAERMRLQSLDDFVGQREAVGPGSLPLSTLNV